MSYSLKYLPILCCAVLDTNEDDICKNDDNHITLHNEHAPLPEIRTSYQEEHKNKPTRSASLPAQMMSQMGTSKADDSLITPNSKTSSSMLNVHDVNRIRSKSTHCLFESTESLNSCMIVPDYMSLEDIASNNQRLSMTGEEIKKQAALKARIMRRLKYLKDNF